MSRRFRDLIRLPGFTSAPAAPTAGDVWYRSDLDQVHASDGESGQPLTVGPSGNLPAIRSTAWHGLPPYGSNGTANVPDGRMFAIPFWPGRACVLTGMAFNVSLALVGGSIRLGLYAADEAVPTSLIADYGTVSAGLSGIHTLTGISTPVRPVLHYLVIGRQGGAANLGLTTRLTWDPIVSEATPTGVGDLNSYYITGVGGALPASFGTPAGLDTGPALWAQLT